MLHQAYERKRVGQRGRHFIWAFTEGSMYVREVGAAKSHYATSAQRGERAVPFFKSLEVLTSMGLLYPVAHLVENSDEKCEIIHPFGTNDNAELYERDLAEEAMLAGEHMVGESLAQAYSNTYLVPVYDSYPNVQMVGVYRIRYRPRTS